MLRLIASLSMLLLAGPALAEMKNEPVEWTIGDTSFSGVLVYDDVGAERRPGLVMVPNWMGVTGAAIAQAERIAGDDYVVLVADVYGEDVRPADSGEALAAVQAAYSDGGTALRQRAAAAVGALKGQAGSAPLDPERIGVLGFCFGGSVALELARSGADLAGVVSLHGGLETHLPTEGNEVNAPVLVFNGAEDKSVTDEQIAAFKREMDAAGADWTFVEFSDARHCFTHPEDADNPPDSNCLYNERAAKSALRMMFGFFNERFRAQP